MEAALIEKSEAVTAENIGTFDGFRGKFITGWAINPSNHAESVEVGLYIDGLLYDKCLADFQRADLATPSIGNGSGKYGFRFPLPSHLNDKRIHSVDIKIIATNKSLGYSPRTYSNALFLNALNFAELSPWIDKDGFAENIQARIIDGRVNPKHSASLEKFRNDGYVILPQAIPHDLIDQMADDLKRMYRDCPEMVVINHNSQGMITAKTFNDFENRNLYSFRVIDYFIQSRSAMEIMMAKPVMDFLRDVYDEPPAAMQTLLFEYGSEQRAHQDFPYVHTPNPARLAAAWVACEDVVEDAGPLFYYPESNRKVPKYDFGGGNIYTFNDGQHVRAFEEYLEQACVANGCTKQVFLPKKGDVLIWHTALVHGGSKRLNRNKSRLSLVTHYSPESVYGAESRRPAQSKIKQLHNGGVYLRDTDFASE